ncbi:unnamed protein product [Scytosiphon promiscuus]
MGNLMGLLWRDGHAGYDYNLAPLFDAEGDDRDDCRDGDDTCTGTERGQPPESPRDQQDRELYGRLCLFVERCSEAIELVQDYEGCGAIIGQSMREPGDEVLQAAATKALLPNAAKIQTFFQIARDLEQLMPVLLRRLAELGSIVERPLLACKLAELLQAVLEFDFDIAMLRPQIQNDFATYRRYLSRLKTEQEAGLLSELPVADTDANAISMFIAENVPMMVVAAKVTAETAIHVPRVHNVIATVANMCCGMVHRQAYTNDTTGRKLLMAMTSAAVLYDRITDSGVFVKRSHVGVSKCIKVLNKHGGATGEQLRATLRYSTMHYNEDTTPRNIRNALKS